MAAPASARAPAEAGPPTAATGFRSAPAPLVWVAVACMAGIIAGRSQWNPASWWLVAAALVLATASLLYMRARLGMARGLALIAIALTSAASLQLAESSQTSWPNNSDFVRLSDGRETLITGHVIREGVFHIGALARESVDVETEQIADGDQNFPLRFGLRVSVYASPEENSEDEQAATPPLPRLRYGERVQFAARLHQPRNFMDPGAFDYRDFLAQQRIAALASVRQDRLTLLPGFAGTRLGDWHSRIRRDLLDRIHVLWAGRAGAIMSAMLLGDRTGIDRETMLDYQRTGAYHILVVAGLKVGVLAFTLLWLLRLFRLPEPLTLALTLTAMTAYAWITEANAPVVRATLMLAAYLIARMFYRERAAMNAVAMAAVALLVGQPRSLYDASFQLTFVSMLAIVGIAMPLAERTSLPLRRALRQLASVDYDFALAPRLVQLRLELRMVLQRVGQLLGSIRLARWMICGALWLLLGAFDLLLLSATLQLALALPMAWYFHRAVTLALPANVAVVPLHSLLLPVAGLAVCLSYFSWNLAALPAKAAMALLGSTNHAVEALAHWRLSGIWIGDLRVATPTVFMGTVCAVALLLCLWSVRKRKLAAACGLAALLASAIWVALPRTPQIASGQLEITALDVGQGDSLLIVSPQGRTLLIDAGGELGAPGGSHFDMGEDVVSPALWARGITHLDAVALTHAHADHIGGMASVVANFHPAELWLGPEPSIPPVLRLLRQASQENVQVVRRKLGEKFSFGGAEVSVLGPPADWEINPDKAENNDSLVMKISNGATSALLEGDAEKQAERELAEEDVSAALLKVGHHGSSTSTTPAMLAAVHPQFAVISVGYRSPFHHPRPQVLERLQQAHVRTFRTDTMGATTFLLDGRSVSAHTNAASQ